jgi:hypothetical protein
VAIVTVLGAGGAIVDLQNLTAPMAGWFTSRWPQLSLPDKAVDRAIGPGRFSHDHEEGGKLMAQHLYVYSTGERDDGYRFAVGHFRGPGPTLQLGLFRDKVDAHLSSHDKAERLVECSVLILPSAELGTSSTGWPLHLLRTSYKAARRGDLLAECPNCRSLNTFTSIRPGTSGTGPGRTWRMGDDGGHGYTECQDCHAASDLPVPKE